MIDTILKRMLGNLNSIYDKTVGSFFYDFFSTIAIEINSLQEQQTEIKNNIFVDTATGEHLTLKCKERGVDRKQATPSSGYVTIKGKVGAIIPKGELVASELINFKIMENKTIPVGGSISVLVQCESSGTIGNVPTNSITSFPKTLSGLYEVTNPDKFINGYNEESDEELRDRYYLKVRTPATSGNKYEYQSIALEVNGVGGARVIPRWNGRHTVKVVIISSNKTGAGQELITNVFNHIEDKRPIGADITVISAKEKPINISVKLAVDIDNFTTADVQLEVIEKIKEHIKSMAFQREYISYARIGGVILDTEGVIDYSNLLINGDSENISIGNEEVAILGGVTFE